MTICGLLVINHDYRKFQQNTLDKESWVSLDNWVVSTDSTRIAEFFESTKNDRAQTVVVEPNRSLRYQRGLEAAREFGDYVFLFHPGQALENFDLPELSNDVESVRLPYLDNHNRARWLRTLVLSSLEWKYDLASAQWVCSDKDVAETVDRKTWLRENPENQHVAVEWAAQLHALLRLQKASPSSEYLAYEVALSYLRLGDESTAYEWFSSVTNFNGESPQSACAISMLARINKYQKPLAKQIARNQEAVRKASSFADSHFHLAEHLFVQQDYQGALDVANRWKNSDINNGSALDYTVTRTRIPRLMAQCYQSLGNHTEAVRYYNYALSFTAKHYQPSSEEDGVGAMYAARDDSYSSAFPIPETRLGGDNFFKIIVSFWNAAEFLQGCVDSIAIQDYSNYEVIFIDDCSTDGGLDKVDLSQLSAYRIVRPSTRRGPLRNQVSAVLEWCEDSDIVVVLDGDDTFSGSDVLTHLNDVYCRTDCWATIGQFKVDDDWRLGYARPILPAEDISKVFINQTLRFPVHLRTHRAGLLHRLREADAELNAFKNAQGNYFFYASDVAYCRAILCLAGSERVRYIPKILMNYNATNPLSVHQNHKDLQRQCCIEIAQLSPLEPLASYVSEQ